MVGRVAGSVSGVTVGFVAMGMLYLSACGGASGLGRYVAEDCTTTPADIVSARKSLRNTGLSKCADVATCDDAFVLAQLAGAAGCEAVTLAGATEATVATGADDGRDAPTAFSLYFESSASMNAYLAQQRGLKDHLLDIIQRLQTPGDAAADSLRLFYIGERSAPYRDEPMDFVSTLVPGRMPSVGTATSDIADLVRAAFAKTGPAEAVVLVSDFVFSPGRGVDAQQYLAQQKIVIRDLVQRQLQTAPDFSVALVSAVSDFDGSYYDRNNKVYKHRGERPYYYLVAGPRSLVLRGTERIAVATGGEAVFFSPATLEVPLAFEPALANRSQGSFRVSDEEATPTIQDAKPAIGGPNDGYLLLNLEADLSGLADPAAAVERAQLPAGFELVQVDGLRRDAAPYTHRVTLRRRGTQYPGTLLLTLPRAGAGDLSARYLVDDAADPSTFPGQTFGLQQLVEGIEGAYARYADEPAATMTFAIQ